MNTYEIRITLDDDQDLLMAELAKEDKALKGSVQKYLQKVMEPIVRDQIHIIADLVLEKIVQEEKPWKILSKLKKLEKLEEEK